MSMQGSFKWQLSARSGLAVQFLSLLVAAHGAYILAYSLLDQVSVHRGARLSDLTVDIPLLIGLSLLYLGTLLRRRKRTAWLVTIMAYTFYLGNEVSRLAEQLERPGGYDMAVHAIARLVVLPLVILVLLLMFRKQFVVKSDIQGFRFAAQFIIVVLLAALVYGVAGFSLLDKSDFHQEISFPAAIHYTVDQFNLTTNKPVQPYTRRAKLFTDSLSVVSVGAVVYAAIALFQPLRSRWSDQRAGREHMTALLARYGGHSEEFFKLWPHDKQYFFDVSGQSGVAFHVSRGAALCLGGPIGSKSTYAALFSGFTDQCFVNDWLPAFIHVTDQQRKLYEQQGFSLQKLGQEAVLDLQHFQEKIGSTKYFRQIQNKFDRHGFTHELLQPPHHNAVLERLRVISDEWLSRGGRAERGFVMGSFSEAYMQMCKIMVVRDAAGTIQAFINVLPADFDTEEADYDMLRHTTKALGNINDFLLVQLINWLPEQGYKRLNLGLCPLTGLDEDDDEKNKLIDSVMRFAYANGDRFYSFSGLYRFKAKYEPEWRDRYVAYQGGLRGFSRTMAALMRAMRV